MKRKRGIGKRKPKKPVVTEDEPFNNTEQYGLDGINEDHFESGMEARASEINTHEGSLRAGLEEQGAASGRVYDNRTLLSGIVTGNQHKAARSIATRSSRRMGSSNTNLSNSAVLMRERTLQEEASLPYQDPRYKPQELNAALEVIKKVMQMGAARPFNVPVDPIAQGIPDYFDVIDTRMDFGTICGNLETGIKYLNSKEVFEDVQYIWENCSKYNKKGHYILELMKQVKKSFTKYWTSAGLYCEPPAGNDGHSHVHSTMEPPMSRHTQGSRYHLGIMADNPIHQQSKTRPDHPQLHLASASYKQQFHPHQRSFQCHPGSSLSHPFCPQAATNSCCARHTHSPSPAESLMEHSTYGRRCLVGSKTDYDPNHQHSDQTGFMQPQLPHPPLTYSQSCPSQQWPCQCQLCTDQLQFSQGHSGKNIGGAGHTLSTLPSDSTMRRDKSGLRCVVGPMTDDASHQWQEQINVSQLESHRHSACQNQPQQKSYHRHQSSCQPQPSQPEVGTYDRSAGHTFSTPPLKSTMRCSSMEVPMTDSPSHQWQEEISLSQGQRNKLLASHSQQHQPSQPSPPKGGTDNCTADSGNIKRKRRGRGPARCLKLLNGDGTRISVPTNELGQPVGEEAAMLSSYIGILARNGHLAPLTYVNWREFPDENKENMWQEVLKKFDIDPICKSWVWVSLGRTWKNWKALLKSAHYNTHETDEERLADRDKRVPADQWRVLISYWNSEEAQALSMKNKANRAQNKMYHATGTKSFARIREEERARRSDGKEPSQAELFIMTRTRKDGQPVNEASAAVISKIREQAAQKENSQSSAVLDDIFSKVVGRDKNGRMRTYGLGQSPLDLKSSRKEAIRMVSQANAEVHEMKERMKSMEQTCAQMASQMTTMMSMMSTMHQKRSEDEHVSNVVANVIAGISSGSEGSVPLQVNSSAFHSSAPSSERRTTRGKKQNTVLSAGCTRSRSKLG